MRVARLLLLAFAIHCGAAQPGAAETIRVAAASDLQAVLPAVASQFEQRTGDRVLLTFGSSGNFFTQIQNGAPFDVFMSADIDYPRRLERAGQTEPGQLYEYATGRIVLWARSDSGIDLRQGLAVLATSRVRRVAIANPDHAPYGRAAIAALRHAQLYEQVEGKLVRGENISQAAQFVQSGNAEAGIMALSLALSPALKMTGSYVAIPDDFYPPIQQAAVVVARTHSRTTAHRFLDFLKTAETVRLLESFGFVLPRPTVR
jgi:molybdate transport system substrate-binding protein